MIGRIDGATRLVGLLGWPVSHSLSPQMHNAAFMAVRLNWVYVPLAVSPDRLRVALQGLAALGFAGANVTVPHKQAVLEWVDRLTPTAEAVGAVNTILVQPDGSLLGDNTDVPGFLADLSSHRIIGPASRAPAEGKAILLGAGGAARAVAYALASVGVTVAIVNRALDKAESLCADIRRWLPAARLSAHAFPEALPALAADAWLVVNATSLGLHADDPLPWPDAIPFRRDQVVYDLIYSRPTGLLDLAARSGARAINGLGMLIHQGARSFELWTGKEAPVDVMAAALRAGD